MLRFVVITKICRFEYLHFSRTCKNEKKFAIFLPNILVHQKLKLLDIRMKNTSNECLGSMSSICVAYNDAKENVRPNNCPFFFGL